MAGATFMAAAGPLPSLVASIAGINGAQTEVVLVNSLGSGVVKAAGVLAVATLFSKGVVKLSVWSVVRSSACYLVSILLIVCIILDDSIEWWAAPACLLAYALYVTAMLFDGSLRSVSERMLPRLAPKPATPDCAANTLAKCSEIGADVHDGPQAAQTDSGTKGLLWRLEAIVLRTFKSSLSYVIPDCRKPGSEKFFVVTFALSGCFIAVAAYVLVWMLAVVGSTFGIPDSTLGQTLLSISSTFVISSVLALREGLGNVAVSSLLGSNIFDLLLGLGLPWLLQTSVFKQELRRRGQI